MGVLCNLVLFAGTALTAFAQHRPMDVPDAQAESAPARTRLILKDGSYQLVLSYKVVGDVVRYRSAERDGESEDLPLALVDLTATKKWVREHGTDGHGPDAGDQRGPVLSPQLAKEEADRAARTPEVAPNLRLPDGDSVLALDTFNGTPQLVPIPQQGGDLNKETAHNVLKADINPSSTAHRILDVPGTRADIQVHVADPVFYVRVGDDESDAAAGSLTVDTHGASGRATPGGGSDASGYVIERLDVRYDTRVVDSFRLQLLGVKPQVDVIEMKQEDLPGGHWMKLTPVHPLEFGEYALVEVLSGHELNLGVWDFGVHPDARENAEAIRPEVRRPATLERRDR